MVISYSNYKPNIFFEKIFIVSNIFVEFTGQNNRLCVRQAYLD